MGSDRILSYGIDKALLSDNGIVCSGIKVVAPVPKSSVPLEFLTVASFQYTGKYPALIAVR